MCSPGLGLHNIQSNLRQNITLIITLGSGCEYVDTTLPYGTECIVPPEDAGAATGRRKSLTV